ncbi:hypothetical protein C1H46_025937 [Malus baccata]|uniref:EF-hand domain-containing protein n=1 Tax=Malus baccata TaxID=106549 RepID=A0A540LPV3_MALBA|nr:hypothetical protein C1H46_025937 [Malus baccata]
MEIRGFDDNDKDEEILGRQRQPHLLRATLTPTTFVACPSLQRWRLYKRLVISAARLGVSFPHLPVDFTAPDLAYSSPPPTWATHPRCSRSTTSKKSRSTVTTHQEIVSLYQRFCQLDRSGGGFISSDEFLSVPEFAVNPLSQRLLKILDGLNFKEFVLFLSAFSSRASLQQKIEFIFKVYDSDGNGKVAFSDMLDVLRDLTGQFISEQQREVGSLTIHVKV